MNKNYQFVSTSNQLGNGMYNATVATQVRFQRLQDSMARNPVFDFTTPRFFTAYAEAVFPYRFFVDGRSKTAALDMDAARGFFQDSHFPDDFHRREGAFGLLEIGPDVGELQTAHPVPPGRNDGAGNYVTDPSDPVLLKGVRLSLQRPSPPDHLRLAHSCRFVAFTKSMQAP